MSQMAFQEVMIKLEAGQITTHSIYVFRITCQYTTHYNIIIVVV
jgi:hypothetical protein